VLDVVARGFRGDDELVGDPLAGQSPREQPQHLDLAGSEPRGSGHAPARGVPGRGEDGFDRIRVQRAVGRLDPQLRRSGIRGQRRAVRPWLAHRLVGVGGAQEAGEPRDRTTRQACRVAGAVEPFPVLDGDGAQRGEERRLAQHALGEVRVQPHPLPLPRAERAGFVPDGVRDAEPADVVHQARAAHSRDLRRAPPR